MNKIFYSYDRNWDDGFVIHTYSGYHIEHPAFCDDLDWNFNPYYQDIEYDYDIGIIECELVSTVDYYGEHDYWFEIIDIREPTNQEWDDIMFFGVPLWPTCFEFKEEDEELVALKF